MLGRFLRGKFSSGDAAAEWVYDELFLKRTGKLFDYRGCELPIEAVNPMVRARFEGVFGKDEGRFLHRILECANKPPKYRLQDRCVFPVMMLSFAVKIHTCHTVGVCRPRA